MAKRPIPALQALTKSEAKKVTLLDPASTHIEGQKTGEPPTLVKSILNVLNGGSGESIERLAFEQDPNTNNTYASIFRGKLRLIPDAILKRIAIQDDLVAAIANARSNQLSAFGRPQPDRFSTGFKTELKPGVSEDMTDEEKEEVQKRIEQFNKRLSTCGDSSGWSDVDQMTFSQYLYQQTRNAVILGRFATEAIYVNDKDGQRRFHSFRPIDAGTIYAAVPQQTAAEQVRSDALHLIEQLKNKKLRPERFQNDEYSWIQVIEGRPVQAFTSEECLVHNVYPVTDVELMGYPLTPLDTVIQAVTTHINITRHNRLYFEHGRASKGILVVKSEDVDDAVIAKFRQSMQAAVTGVANSWRMPVFGVGAEEDVTFQPIDSGGRDMEFQYLSDSNARVILSAFQMSPEELPGYAHLSRGTNNQALSEGNNEYKLEAHRDVGIRPLIAHFQDFLNNVLFPLMDERLAKLCYIRLTGIDAETAEKESVRIQQDMVIHMSMDDVLEKVEKDPIGKRYGGQFPLNQQFAAVLDKYVPVGVILEKFFDVQGASKDPQFQYLRDPFWFQWQQLQLQMQQMQAQMQAQQAQAAQGGPPQGGGGGDAAGPQGGGQEEAQQPPEESGQQQPQQGEEGQGDLTRSIDQLLGALTKSEAQLPTSKRAVLARQRKMMDHVMKEFENEKRKTIDEILDIAEKHGPAIRGV